MSATHLKHKLDEALDDFAREVDFIYDTMDDENVTRDELKELGKQVFYTLGRFRNEIVKELRKG